MYFRCVSCLATTWLDGSPPVRTSARIRCADCRQWFSARADPRLGSTMATHYQATLRFANENDVDMPSAYAVLLGLLDLEGLRFLQGRSPEAEPAESQKPDRVAPALAHYDPAFREAIETGRLSLREAVRRGDREAFALTLVHRHRISRTDAYRVADNEIALRQVIGRRATPADSASQPVRPAVGRRWIVTVLVASTAAVGFLGWHIWGSALAGDRRVPASRSVKAPLPRPQTVPASLAVARTRPAERRLAVTTVRTNAEGEMVEIIGPDPVAVLLAFCESRSGVGELEPIEITETVPRLGDARLGVFRDLGSLQHPVAVWMRKDRRTRRWIAGDGKGPIPTRPAPELPPGSARIPVSSH